MKKRLVSVIAAFGLIGGAVTASPASAQDPPAQPTEVPATVLIEDPFGDANGLGEDNTTPPADGGSQTDIGKVWFSHDATSFQVHVLTEGAPTANSLGFKFEVETGPDGCLLFEGYTKGQTYPSDNLARVTDGCNELDRLAEGTHVVFAAGPGGEGGLATITVPRSYSPLLTDGSILQAPVAATFVFVGSDQTAQSAAGVRGVAQPIDDTKPGTDYVVAGAGGEGPGEPPVKPEKPKKPKKPGKGKPKGCDKGKGKKTGCPTPPPAACASFTPAEAGKDKPTITVTDAATEAAPLEQKVTLDASTADIDGSDPTHDAFNFQIDSAAADAGFYALIEFPERDDYDLNMMYGDGSYAARS
ncbi:MAG: hypothetical protein M3279_09170, partial [Actinomycetota bacterium]|nr:hypothetical protein [Actinomycetota bacterium]